MKPFLMVAAAVLSLTLAACSDGNNNENSAVTATEKTVSVDSHTAAAAPPTAENTAALPSFTVQDVSGKSINLQSLKGKKVFVNLWATWCPPCRAELPSIAKLARSVEKNNVAFVMLSLDDNFNKAIAYFKSKQLSLPVYYPLENLPASLSVKVIPTTFIFDERGNLVQRVNGGDNYDTEAYRKLLR